MNVNTSFRWSRAIIVDIHSHLTRCRFLCLVSSVRRFVSSLRRFVNRFLGGSLLTGCWRIWNMNYVLTGKRETTNQCRWHCRKRLRNIRKGRRDGMGVINQAISFNFSRFTPDTGRPRQKLLAKTGS